jgi:hypothetical protein
MRLSGEDVGELMGRKHLLSARHRKALRAGLRHAFTAAATGGMSETFQKRGRRHERHVINVFPHLLPGKSLRQSIAARKMANPPPIKSSLLAARLTKIAEGFYGESPEVNYVGSYGRSVYAEFMGKSKKKKRRRTLGRIFSAIATGGVSEMFQKNKLSRIARAVATGGASEMFQKGKLGVIARAIGTGGASMLFEKGKAGKIARRIMGAVATGGISEGVLAIHKKKVKEEKAIKTETAQVAAAEKTEVAAQQVAAVKPKFDMKKLLPFAPLVAVPFLLGE